MKKIVHLIIEARVRMINKEREAKEGTILNEIWKFTSEHRSNLMWTRMEQLLRDEKINISLQNINIKAVNKHYESEARRDLIRMKTTEWVRIPRNMWKPKKFILDADWSRTYIQFLVQNAGLGNRTNKLSSYSNSDATGRVILCPICIGGYNNEKHLLLKCPALTSTRRSYNMIENISLFDWIDQRQNQDDDTTMREFLGNTRQDLTLYMDRGLCLIHLRKTFFSKWSEKCGSLVQCSLE
jgi:hypothetical protein